MSSYKEQIDKTHIPAHIAIIMDGNGRWAKQRGQKRSFGHQAGAETVHVIAEEAARLGVKYLTLYTFSTENWNRPIDEVAALMSLLMDSIEEEIFMKNNIRFRIIGDAERLPENVLNRLNECIEHTAGNTGMCLVLALSYSSRWELTDAMKHIAQKVAAGELKADEISDETISQNLTTNFMPDPDLLIRTGGEVRLSNYLLWQCAYSELYFCDTFWPDFKEEELCKAICDYQHRDRRFGKNSHNILNYNIRYRFLLPLLTLISISSLCTTGYAQENTTTAENDQPVILYNGTPKKYEIADIKVEGVKNYEDYVLIGISGLAVGQTITVPGDDITSAIKRYWRHGLFSDVKIFADKIVDNKIYLRIQLAPRQRITDIRYSGVKKSEREDLQKKLGLVKGSQITPNLINRAKILIKKHFDEKGFKNAEVNVIVREDKT